MRHDHFHAFEGVFVHGRGVATAIFRRAEARNGEDGQCADVSRR
jgi:hypothetical protein